MIAQQLELNLWQGLEIAKEEPAAADIKRLWQQVEVALALLPPEQQLQVAGEAIAQLAQVFALKAESLLTQLEARNSSAGPVLSENFLDGLMRQSMTIDLADLMDDWQPESPEPEPQAEVEGSIAVPIDKQTARAIAAQRREQLKQRLLDLAHAERTTQNSQAIATWMQQQAQGSAVSLLRLQQALGMPLIEVWLGLLSDGRQYEWKCHGSFYGKAEEILLKI